MPSICTLKARLIHVNLSIGTTKAMLKFWSSPLFMGGNNSKVSIWLQSTNYLYSADINATHGIRWIRILESGLIFTVRYNKNGHDAARFSYLSISKLEIKTKNSLLELNWTKCCSNRRCINYRYITTGNVWSGLTTCKLICLVRPYLFASGCRVLFSSKFADREARKVECLWEDVAAAAGSEGGLRSRGSVRVKFECIESNKTRDLKHTVGSITRNKPIKSSYCHN